MKKIFIIISLIFLTACSSKYEEAFKDLKNGNPKAAFEKCKYSYEPGCRYLIGAIYKNGLGVKQNIAKGVGLVKEAAEKGFPEAIADLGSYYERGIGVPADYKKAVELYKEAIKKGVAASYFNLGRLYINGQGVEVDKEKAVTLFKKGFEKGDKNSIRALFLHFLNKDEVEELLWLKRGVEAKEPFCLARMAYRYRVGYKTKKDLYKAKELYELAAERGNVEAQRMLGQCYIYGIGTEIDKKKGAQWVIRAATRYDPKALYFTGILYYFGIGVEKNLVTAYDFFLEGANRGDLHSKYRLALCLLLGHGTKQHPVNAINLLIKISNQSNDAKHLLGIIYFEGKLIKKNLKVAKYWIENAAFNNYAKSQHFIAFLYHNGMIYKKDNLKSYIWINIAIANTRDNKQMKKNIQFREIIEKKITGKDVISAQETIRTLLKNRKLFKKFTITKS